MVALSGRGWQLAPCLVAMVEEANRIAPQRIRTADGSIGDMAHAVRSSDHNPADGWVTAVDLTHAPASGFDAHARARMVVARRDPRIKYVISNRQIARGYAKPGVPAWTWTAYTGSNQHVLHAHFSVNNTAACRNDRSLWWPHSAAAPRPAQQPLQEDEMTPELKAVLDRMEMRLIAVQEQTARTEMRTIAVHNITADLAAGKIDPTTAAAQIAAINEDALAEKVADVIAGRLKG